MFWNAYMYSSEEIPRWMSSPSLIRCWIWPTCPHLPLATVQMFGKGEAETTVVAADHKENKKEARHCIVPVSILIFKQNICFCYENAKMGSRWQPPLCLTWTTRPYCDLVLRLLLSPFLELMCMQDVGSEPRTAGRPLTCGRAAFA